MKEIRDKLCELATAYEEQLKLYEQIRAVGAGEQELIGEGQLDGLLKVLKEKEDLLTQAGGYEQRIKTVQDQLVRHFDLDAFSLPQLKLVAPSYYREELYELEEAIANLLPVLEALEAQERRNEEALNKYLDATQVPKVKTAQVKRAGQAYGKK